MVFSHTDFSKNILKKDEMQADPYLQFLNWIDD